MAPRKEAPANARGLDALRSDLGTAGARPVYLMVGDDRREIDAAIELLQAAAVPEGLEGFNVARVRGLEDTFEDAVAACEILPMLGDRRFVLAREPEKLKGDAALLVAYVKSPCPSTTLVLAPQQLDRRLGWVKATEAAAFTVAFDPPKGRELEAHVRKSLSERGVSIAPDALALLLDLVAAQTILLANEVDKLALACAQSGKVTTDDVAAIVGRTRAIDVWALTNAIEDADQAAALGSLRRLLDDGAAPPMIVGMLDWCLGRLFAGAEPTGFPPRMGQLKQRRSELRGRGERLFGLLRRADRLVRTTGGSPEAALELAVAEAAAP